MSKPGLRLTEQQRRELSEEFQRAREETRIWICVFAFKHCCLSVRAIGRLTLPILSEQDAVRFKTGFTDTDEGESVHWQKGLSKEESLN